MVLNAYPKQSFGFMVEEMDDESILYRLGTHKAIHLNATAAAIWKLSDGTRSVQNIIDFLSEEYPDARQEIEGDVLQAINQLSAEGAVSLRAMPTSATES